MSSGKHSEHCVRHWCSNCGYDQAGGVNGEAHSFRSGVCSNAATPTAAAEAAVEAETSVTSSTRTSWSGCDWYEYCRSCGALVDYGTSHGTCVWRVGVLQQLSQHRQLRLLRLRRGNLSLRLPFGFNAVRAVQRSQHRTVQSCSVCNATRSPRLFRPYLHLQGSWQSDSATQHCRTKTYSACGYSGMNMPPIPDCRCIGRPTRGRELFHPPQAAALLRLRGTAGMSTRRASMHAGKRGGILTRAPPASETVCADTKNLYTHGVSFLDDTLTLCSAMRNIREPAPVSAGALCYGGGSPCVSVRRVAERFRHGASPRRFTAIAGIMVLRCRRILTGTATDTVMTAVIC